MTTLTHNRSDYAPQARIVKELDDHEIEVTFKDTEGETDVHFGLIPLDPTILNTPVEPRYVAAYVTEAPGILDASKGVPPSENEKAVLAFTNGDNYVEWGEALAYDNTERDPASGRFYGAPGLHVVVRFGAMGPVEAEYYPESRKPYPPQNPTGLWKDERGVAADRQTALYVEGLAVVETVFADMLNNGWRLCDYACMSDATDWAEAPTWMVGPGRLLGSYA